MKYFITGITGFAGAHLANLLFQKNHEIYALVRCSNGMEADILDVVSPECFNSINFLYGNLNDYNSLEKIFSEFDFDGVFHLAAQSHPPISFLYPIDTFRTNIMGSANIIELIEKHQPDCKLMFCSTSEVYGNTGKEGDILKETATILPSNPYAASKAATDMYMQERMANGKIKGFITRAFSHTGPRRGKNFSISSDAYQIAQIIKGKQEPVLEVGNLNTVRVVIDVRDCVNAYYLLMVNENSNGKIFNVCGNVPRKMEFYTDFLIDQATGGELRSISGLEIKKKISEKYYRKIDISYQHGDSTRVRELTGWTEIANIKQTLSDLLNYWLKKISINEI